MPTNPLLTVGGFSLGLAGRKPFFSAPTGLSLPTVGTYALEGPNGSGKSMLVRLLTGTLPRLVEPDQLPAITINGRPVSIQTSRDALKAGIVAVFQDDNLIPSMTVIQQIYLRHGKTQVKDLIHFCYAIFYRHTIGRSSTLLSWVSSSLPTPVVTMLKVIKPVDVDWRGRSRIRKEAEELLNQHGVEPSGILDQLPTRLSGGGLAIAKLVSAQLYRNTKLLILDEAFSGVQRDVWPSYVSTLRSWSKDTGAAILTITHNSDELTRWQPQGRLEIRDRQLGALDQVRHGILRRGAPAVNDVFPVFEIEDSDPDAARDTYNELWRSVGRITKCLILAGDRFADLQETKDLIKSVAYGVKTEHISVSPQDLSRGVTYYEELLDLVSSSLLDGHSLALVIVGGRDVLNLGAIVSSSLVKWHFSTILVPSTLNSMVSAVVGSLFAVNMRRSSVPSGMASHLGSIAVSSYLNPNGILTNKNYVNSLNQEELRAGLVECLKTGLLQDKSLFVRAAMLLSGSYVDPSDAYAAVKSTLLLLSDLVEIDPWGQNLGRIRSFGRLHAAVISASTNISTGSALLLGMILECMMTNSYSIEQELLQIARNRSITLPGLVWSDLLSLYQSSLGLGYRDGESFKSLSVSSIGEFNILTLRSLMSSIKDRRRMTLEQFAARTVFAAERLSSTYDVQIAYAKLGSLLPPL